MRNLAIQNEDWLLHLGSMQMAPVQSVTSGFSALLHEAALPVNKEAILALWCILEASSGQEKVLASSAATGPAK